MNSKRAGIASLYILAAIILGAFGAHALKEIISAERLVSFETGVRYQMYIGISMLVLALNEKKFDFDLKWVWILLNVGLQLFCVSIYLLALQEPLKMDLKFLGPITPLGGLSLIIAWLLLLVKVFRGSKS